MSTTYTTPNVVTRLVPIECYACGVGFGMTEYMDNERRKDKRTFYCPNGHGQHYLGETDAQKYKRLYEAENARLVHTRDQLQSTEMSRRAYKGQARKLRGRIAAGLCPSCNTEFPDLGAHVQEQHPELDPAND